MNYLRIWLASARYSMVRTMMFRGDFIMWSLVEFFWMGVNLLLLAVIYRHTDSIAGWGQWEMLLLMGTSMLLQRLTMGLFWTNLFEFGRNVRSGHFDFFLAQPGHPLFMVSTRKLDPDGLANAVIAIAVVLYAARQLGLELGVAQLFLYGGFIALSLVIHYSILLLVVSSAFWFIGNQGLEGCYFNVFEFSRLPRDAYRGIVSVIFVYGLPAVVASNAPARILIHGFEPHYLLWLAAVAVFWLGLALFVFNRGLRRYGSASS